jgi:hypothetical protein
VATAAAVAVAVANATPAAPLTTAADALLTLVRMLTFVAVRLWATRGRRFNLYIADSIPPQSIPKMSLRQDRNCGGVDI